jgi:hypothetical protein
MRHLLTLTAFAAIMPLILSAQEIPTFHADVAPIIYNHCTECHRVGEIGPMPFTTFEEVADYAGMIEWVTASGYMPPWTPDHTYSTLRGERFLTDEELAVLAEWAAAGAPEGVPSDNPGLPSFPEGSQVGEPDLVLSMPEAYVHSGDMTDQYQVFVIPLDLDAPQEIRAIEVRPGNAAIAHHTLIAYTENPAVIAQAMALDAADPAPGYESFGDYGVPVEDFLFGGWVPGSPPSEFPPTIGKVVSPDGVLLMQMHYGPSPVEESDQTEVNLFFADTPVEREVELFLLEPSMLDEPFYIPANTVKTFHAEVEVPVDLSLIGVTPHCHLLGQSWEVYAESEGDTIPLISIPEWDFNWQGIFTFPSLLHVPAGYTLHAICTYDNTTANPFNPSDPPIPVSWGEFTEDEMFVMFLQFVPYLPGDEEISLSSPNQHREWAYAKPQLFPLSPNPIRSGSLVEIGWMSPTDSPLTLEVFDMHGRRVRTIFDRQAMPAGIHKELRVADWGTGEFLVVLSGSDGGGHRSHRKLVVLP